MGGLFLSNAALNSFERAFLKELKNNNVSIFAGAGLSASSGFVNWQGLLEDIAKELELDAYQETDLVSLAQYHYNVNGRQTINDAIVNEFQRKAEKNENMNILARLPISVYWTTNYDSIIEETLEENEKITDVKFSSNQLKNFMPNRDAVVYKMHGDRSHPDDAVIIRDDYESYETTKSLFTTQLKGELVSKTFLFIGFSFEDPNLERILSKIRVDLMGKSPKTHYCFFRRVNLEDKKYLDLPEGKKKEAFNYDKIKQNLKIQDMKRYGIHSLLVDEYEEITEILRDIEKKNKLNKILISGSAAEYGGFLKDNAEQFLHEISKKLVSINCHIVSGFGVGVGSFVINGALEEIFKTKGKRIDDFLTLRPFPQATSGSNPDLKKLWTEYREDMIDVAGIIIFAFGNKENDEGQVVNANGVKEEFTIAKNQNKFIIPIGSTGYVAKEIFEEVKSDPKRYWYLQDSLDLLHSQKDSNIVFNEIKKIIKKIQEAK